MKKVQFTRTVALEDVPAEVSKMLKESGEVFKKSTVGTFSLLEQELTENKNYTLFLERLETLRVELAKADSVLEDCRNIVAGYVQILTAPEEPQPEKPQRSAEDLRQMQDKMQEALQNIQQQVEE